VEVDADVPMTPASVVKVPVALAAWRAIAAGELDARRRVVVPAIGRTPGPVGLSLMDDDVEMSLRDLVSLMLTISDNPATDAVIAAVGLDAVAALLAELGLAGTAVTSDLMTMLDDMATETGFADYAGLAAYEPTAPGDPTADDIRVRLAATAALDPTRGSRMTARDGVRLLGSIWQDRAGPPDACAWVRRTMGRQLTRHRIASGFPPGVDVAAKSGGLMGVVGNEIGVVTDPDGTSYAVAVFTRSGDPRTRTDARRIDAAIGAVAAHAVGLLRG
jgi:beta-lactamase class A